MNADRPVPGIGGGERSRALGAVAIPNSIPRNTTKRGTHRQKELGLFATLRPGRHHDASGRCEVSRLSRCARKELRRILPPSMYPDGSENPGGVGAAPPRRGKSITEDNPASILGRSEGNATAYGPLAGRADPICFVIVFGISSF